MRQIKKSLERSTKYMGEYAAWEEGSLSDQSFEKYTSSKFRHYCSIKMELLRLQGGLCAYTEKALCPAELYEETCWRDGEYIGECRGDAKGDLEHFDASLKKEGVRPRPWDWKNLFVVDAEVNRAKKEQTVDARFKPDNLNYNPYDWLAYDRATHTFTVRPDLSDDDKQAVRKMLEVLGINKMWNDRRVYLEDKLDDIEAGLKQASGIKIEQFPTAFEMCTT